MVDGNAMYNTVIGMKAVKCRNALCRYMLRQLNNENNFLCADKTLSNLVRNYIINSGNLRLEKYYINYTKQMRTEDDITDTMRTIYIIPKVCFR